MPPSVPSPVPAGGVARVRVSAEVRRAANRIVANLIRWEAQNNMGEEFEEAADEYGADQVTEALLRIAARLEDAGDGL